MAIKRHKWPVVLAVAVCLAAQVFVVVPHHHHSEVEDPCFNIAHCIQHEAAHEADPAQDCCHDHCAPEADPMSGHDCSVRIDVAEVTDARQYRAVLDITNTFNYLQVPELVFAPENPDTITSFTLTRWRQMPVVTDVCVSYIAEVHPARAPSFLV